MNAYVPKLVHLPGTAVSPQLVLHRTLDKLEHIKAVTIIIQWQNDEFATDWSQMRVSELCHATMHLHEQCKKTMFDGENL
jgi:hypothetical protein